MRPLKYSINTTLDGCVDHREGIPDAELHRHSTEIIAQADALILGRVTYEMMESAWRPYAETGIRPGWMDDWMESFALTIHKAKKYVVSDTLFEADWNSEIIRSKDLETKVRELKQQPGKGLYTGGVQLPLALAELGLIDEFEFIAQPRIAGHGPRLLDGLKKPVNLKLISRKEFTGGSISSRFEYNGNSKI